MLSNLTVHYGWWLLALALIGAELLAPGYFLLWIGVAAAALGAVLLFLPTLSVLAQAVLFAGFSLSSCYAYWRIVRRVSTVASDQPLLNRRAEQYVGHRFPLETAIENGLGKVRVGDSLWRVEGPDLPAGSVVEVIGVDGATLRVRRID